MHIHLPALLCAALLPLSALAGPPPAMPAPSGDAPPHADHDSSFDPAACPVAAFAPTGCMALGESRLEALRGGYDAGPGLQLSFGIERLTYINDTLVVHTAFHLADLARLSPQQATDAAAVLSQVHLVQNGPGNSAPPGFPSGVGGTVIQNTLNDQTIRHLTIVSTESNSLQFLRSMNAHTVLQEALAAPLSPR